MAHHVQTIGEERAFVLRTLRFMRQMGECLPDGQWEDGPEEIYDAIKEDRPDVDDPVWVEYAAELRRNMNWWV
jgi:hypothetical protein